MFVRERKALKNKAIRQREKDMKILWGEQTNTKLMFRKEVHKTAPVPEDVDNPRYIFVDLFLFFVLSFNKAIRI